MASKTTLNASNLERLGAARLAELLMEITEGDATARRRLRMELAGAHSPDALAKEVRKRLATIGRSRAFVDWDKQRAFVADLDLQHRAIAEQVAPADPTAALELMWRFLELAESVHSRCDDSNGAVRDVFRDAVADLGTIATAARPDPAGLAERVYAALNAPDFGQYDGLIASLAPALGEAGLAHLKTRIQALAETPVPTPPASERQVVGWSSHRGSIHADELAERQRQATVRSALREIADAEGDVDAYVAQHGEAARRSPQVAADIAQRLVAAGRAEEALAALEAADPKRTSRFRPPAWDDARLTALEALGRRDEAQASRWARFKASLDAKHLRAYLSRLPEFDDVEAEEAALAHAESHASVHSALDFLVSWPALERAAHLVVTRRDELDGDVFPVLTPAADALAESYPLAATILLRVMIDFSLAHAKTTRYRHAARHLNDCARLAARVSDFGDLADHVAYLARLKAEHGRKLSFWRHVAHEGGA